MSAGASIHVPHVPELHLPLRPVMFAAATGIVALAVVVALRLGGGAAEAPGSGRSLYGSQATVQSPSVYFMVRPMAPGALDVAEAMNGSPLENLVFISNAQDEERFLRFIETANSFLLAGGLPGYEVASLLNP